jgi:hypothetical protein
MTLAELYAMRGIEPSKGTQRNSGYDTMKKAALIEAAKQKGVYTEDMDKPATGKAAIIEAIVAADSRNAKGKQE